MKLSQSVTQSATEEEGHLHCYIKDPNNHPQSAGQFQDGSSLTCSSPSTSSTACSPAARVEEETKKGKTEGRTQDCLAETMDREKRRTGPLSQTPGGTETGGPAVVQELSENASRDV